MSRSGPVGVVVMAYGTPRSPEEIEPYYTHIRRGNPPPPERLADLQRRYEAIGGISPLAERTESQLTAIEEALERIHPGRYTTALGQKHAEPFIEDAVNRLADQGVTRTVGLVLAPHYSAASVGQYQARAAQAAALRGLEHTAIDSWHCEQAYVEFLADAVQEAVAQVPQRHKVLFSAHSLPERVLVDDPYPDQLRQSAAAVAARLGLDRWAGWSLCWQSAGATPEPWRGPDLLEVLADLGETGRAEGVVVCPQGFVADHLEVLYDIDIRAAQAASEVGLRLVRTRSLNDDPRVMSALAARIHETALGAATP